MDNNFKKLVLEVREVRKTPHKCHSAQEEISIPELLRVIIQKEVYKTDYEEITEKILEERVPYCVAIEALKQVAERW